MGLKGEQRVERYIKTDILAKIVFDKWQECDELKHIIPAIRNAVMCASTEDVVDRKDLDKITEAHEEIGYTKGYYDGRMARDAEIIRCKDCKHHTEEDLGMIYCPHVVGGWESMFHFCSNGERRDDST